MDEVGDLDIDLTFTRIFADRETDDDTKPKVTEIFDLVSVYL